MRLALTIALLILTQLVNVDFARAQARDTVASLRTRYNTVKTQAKPQGDTKRKFDAIDEQIARAAQLGRSGELRRLYAQGIALAGGREWNPELEFTTSLALRTERVFIDPAKPVALRLEQIFTPSIELKEPLSVRVALHKPGTGAGNPIGEKLQDTGSFDGINRDLIDNPFRFDADLSSVPDGRTVVRAEAFEGSRSLGAATLNIEIHRGLDPRLSRFEAELQQVKGFDALRAEVLYPADYIRNVDRGRITIGQFNYENEIAAAEAALSSIKAGKDPFAGKTGDFKRHYEFREAGEIMPYRLYVPTSYKGDRPYPLVVMLHGNGGTENTFFDGNNQGQLQQLAEQRGYIVVVPLGYRVDGGYGYNNGSRSSEERRKLELSEKDVLAVLNLMKQNYRIDVNRTYLAGHSMGGSGTWYLGPRYPEIWAALASFAGAATPETIPPLKPTPQLIVHGDADATVSVERSRTMSATLKKLGVTHEYIEVPGGTHGNIIAPNLKAMFDFFDKYRKAQSN